MRVRATDTGHAWYVGAEDGRLRARREDSGPDPAAPIACTVTGVASGVYLFLWNRSDAAQAASRSPETPVSSNCGSQACASAGADRMPPRPGSMSQD